MSGFFQESIAAAKLGTHWIQFSPYSAALECRVVKVRKNVVYVSPLLKRPHYADVISLNTTASKMLMRGDYRKKP